MTSVGLRKDCSSKSDLVQNSISVRLDWQLAVEDLLVLNCFFSWSSWCWWQVQGSQCCPSRSQEFNPARLPKLLLTRRPQELPKTPTTTNSTHYIHPKPLSTQQNPTVPQASRSSISDFLIHTVLYISRREKTNNPSLSNT